MVQKRIIMSLPSWSRLALNEVAEGYRCPSRGSKLAQSAKGCLWVALGVSESSSSSTDVARDVCHSSGVPSTMTVVEDVVMAAFLRKAFSSASLRKDTAKTSLLWF